MRIMLAAVVLSSMASCAIAQLTLGVDDRYHFVLSGEAANTSGVNIKSQSGSLLPGPTSETGPFAIMYVGRDTNVAYIPVPGSTLEIDGEVTLASRWNPAGTPDVHFQYGNANFQLIDSGAIFPDVTPNPDAGVTLGLNDNNRFVIRGTGQDLIGIDIRSPSGSLNPAITGETHDFSFVLNNSPERLTYGVFGDAGAVHVDGEITLTGGWNPFGLADVEYSYNLVGPVHSGPLRVEIEEGDRQALGLRMDDDFKFVVSGTGQRLGRLSFASTTGALVRATDPGPFTRLESNNAHTIVYSADDNVVIDGSVTLSAGWNRNLGFRDVKYGYTIDDFDVGSQFIPGSVYPEAPPTNPIGISVDHSTLALKVTGNGHELRDLIITSRSGALIHDEVDPGPFDTVTTSRSTRISLSTDSRVSVDGTVVLPVRFDINSPKQDLSFRYRQVGFIDRRGPFDVHFPLPLTPIRGTIDDDGGFAFQGFQHELESFEIRSPGGALVPGTDPGPFSGFLENSPERIAFSGEALLNGSVDFDFQWNGEAADIEFVYTLKDVGFEFGPRSVGYPAANVISLIAAPNLSEHLVLTSGGIEIYGVDITSETDSILILENIEDADFGPFEIVESYSNGLLSLRSEDPVAIDWLKLPAEWNDDQEADLQLSFIPVGVRAISGVVRYDGAVPEPGSLPLALLATCCAFGMFRGRRMR